MFLVLEIVAGDEVDSLPERAHVFDFNGGGIGRDEGNAWVIPKPRSMHREHAQVDFQSGVFWIRKLGDNTVAIDDPARDIARNDAVALRNGCRLYLDNYEISVRTARERPVLPAAPARTVVAHAPDPPDSRTRPPLPIPGRDRDGWQPGTPERNIDDLLGTGRGRPGSPQESFSERVSRAPSLNDHIALPTGVAAPKPDDFWDPTRLPPSARAPASGPSPASGASGDGGFWDPTRMPDMPVAPIQQSAPGVRRPVSDAPRPPAPATPVRSSGMDAGARLARLLDHLGIDAAAVRDEDIDVLGRSLQQSLVGSIGVVQAREQARSRVGLGRTPVTPQSNPFLRLPNAQAALDGLVRNRLPGMPGLDEALRRTFEELAWHELAVVDAINATRQRFLELFDPAVLERRADETARGGALTSRAKTLWDLYTERFSQLAADSGETFRSWFAREFARAYDQAMNGYVQAAQRAARGA